MRAYLKKVALAAVVVAVPAAAAGMMWMGEVTTTGLAPESMREELAENIVREWSGEASKRYGVPPRQWAETLVPTLRETDISNLEKAASSPDFDSMSLALVGSTSPGALRNFGTKLGQAGSDLVYTPITPCRIVDTREAGGAMAATEIRSFKGYTATDFTSQGGAASTCNIPANISALAISVTSPLPSGPGYFTLYPFNEPMPLTTALNYNPGLILSAQSNTRLCRPSCPSQFNVYSHNQSHLVIDVEGYFAEPVATELECTVAQQTGNLDLLGGLQPRSVNCPAGYAATGGGCGGPLGIGVSNSQPVVVDGKTVGWRCDLVGSLLSVVSYQVNATCCRTPGR